MLLASYAWLLIKVSAAPLPVQLGKMLSMRLQLHKGMRCSTEEAHRNLILRLNLHIRRTLSAGQDQRAKGDGERLLQDGADLSIVNPA